MVFMVSCDGLASHVRLCSHLTYSVPEIRIQNRLAMFPVKVYHNLVTSSQSRKENDFNAVSFCQNEYGNCYEDILLKSVNFPMGHPEDVI